MINIVLCGGSGTRLWPLSRRKFPKQFCQLFDGQSLYQKTLLRNREICSQHLVVTNKDQYFLALEQAEEVGIENCSFLLEPEGKNTAPAIALAAFFSGRDKRGLVTPSDHLISDWEGYKEAVQVAEELARDDKLVTFGLKPTRPETGYGYIKANGQDVQAFVEKPDKEKALEYLKEGTYYWNSGMFCFQLGTFLDELHKWAPEIYQSSQKAYERAKTGDIIRIRDDDMTAIPPESIDYAVMEKSLSVKVVPCEVGWSDMGSFEALYEKMDKDKSDNVQSRKILDLDSRGNFIHSPHRTTVAIDLEDHVVVDTPDALLISRRGSSQKVKEIVEKLEKGHSPLTVSHTTDHRPWGSFTILDKGENYKVKRLEVKSGQRLSLQKHEHRSEHWTIVQGTALVTIGKEEKTLDVNQRAHIPRQTVHRLENPGEERLILIEVQVGDYLGEDDITRLDDDYDRDE